jgi:hypothetical protein
MPSAAAAPLSGTTSAPLGMRHTRISSAHLRARGRRAIVGGPRCKNAMRQAGATDDATSKHSRTFNPQPPAWAIANHSKFQTTTSKTQARAGAGAGTHPS